MRVWIEHLITHAGAYEDFIEYIKSAESTLNKKMHEHLMNGDVNRAKMDASELNAYDHIKKSVNASYRERQSQLQYNETIK